MASVAGTLGTVLVSAESRTLLCAWPGLPNSVHTRPVLCRHKAPTSHLSRAHRQPHLIRTQAVTEPQTSSAASTSQSADPDIWKEFAARVTGEWEGVTATFNADGSPRQLPSHFVPAEFSNWGVQVHDYQSVCSSVASGSGFDFRLTESSAKGSSKLSSGPTSGIPPQSLHYKVKRMLPTVGCEADAVAFVEASETLWPGLSGESERPITADGSYFAGHQTLPGESKATVELCLTIDADGKNRLRLVHRLERTPPTLAWTLANVEVHKERWDSEYHNGEVELSGCGGGQSAFATSGVISKDAVMGSWVTAGGRHLTAKHLGLATTMQATATPNRLTSGSSEGLVLLPLNAWTRFAVSGSGSSEELVIESGVHHKDGSERTVGICSYVSGKLSAVSLGQEKLKLA